MHLNQVDFMMCASNVRQSHLHEWREFSFSLEILPRSTLSIQLSRGAHVNRTWYFAVEGNREKKKNVFSVDTSRAPISHWSVASIGDEKMSNRVMMIFSINLSDWFSTLNFKKVDIKFNNFRYKNWILKLKTILSLTS